MERVKFEIKVFDNYLEIIPIGGMKDNSIYEVKLKGLKQDRGHKELDQYSFKFCTQLTPAYTTIQAVNSLLENCSISEETILYHIREASKYADYIKMCKNPKFRNPRLDKDVQVDFETEQFVKYKAAYDCLLRFYVDQAAEAGLKGTLGDVSFENKPMLTSITPLLNTLKREYDKWNLALQGHTEIRAGIKTGVKAVNSPDITRRTFI